MADILLATLWPPDFASSPGEYIECTLWPPSIEMEAFIETTSMEVSLPFTTIELYTASDLVAIELPHISVSMTASGGTANLAINLKRIYVSMVGGWIAPSTLAVILPVIESVLHSPGGTFATIAVTLPVVEFYGLMSGRTYTTVVVSTKDGSVTTYSNYNFNSYFKFMDNYYGMNSAGIYKLSGSNDAGTTITAQFVTGYTDLKSKKAKFPTDAYIGINSNANVEVRNVIDNIESAVYNCASTDSRYRVRKINFGKGRTGSKMGVSMTSSGSFDIDSITLLAEEKNRYHPGNETWIRAVVPAVDIAMVSV